MARMLTSSKLSRSRKAKTTARVPSGAKSTRKQAPTQSKQEARDPLATYRKKRDFSVTPEPAPEKPGASKSKRKAKEGLEFVVQKHDATRLHYDVRIEIAGAMMSWAVPKGPSFDPSVKRLAVETEDHPIAYNRFEGRIPDGNYGGGDVLIWDRGTYETVPPGQEQAMRAKGHFHLRFFGEKLIGEWHLVRTGGGRGARAGGGAKSQWLMFKANDERADAALDIVASRPESVVSGKSATRGPRRRSASAAAGTPATLLRTVGTPMRAVAAHELSNKGAFLYEIKFDGYRLLGALADGDVELVTRKGNDWTKRFAPVAAALAKLPVREAVIDGEACILDERGRSSFQLLQGWLGGEKSNGTLVFAAFDLLWVDGRDLRKQPIEERRQLLEALLEKAEAPLAFSKELTGPIDKMIEKARRQGLEGLIAKRRESPYLSGGSGAWWKLKFRKEQEVALAGYVPRIDADDEVGALFIAVATPDAKFEWAGKVGTGFDKATRKSLARMLDKDRSNTPTVVDPPHLKGARWSKVKRVAQIELSEWTKDGAARAPSFIALRDDKEPKDCVREREVPVAPAKPTKGVKPAPAAAEVPLTHPEKVLFPRDGITKADVAAYYASISDVMLPHLAGRPIGVQRWPNGIDEEAWFQQNAPEKVPPFVRLMDTGAAHGSKRKIIVENGETLAWLSNLAALTIHQWASHVPAGTKTQKAIEQALHQADYAVLDLDPGDGTWDHVIEVAETLRGLLEKLELASVVKTSGQRGLHIIVPFKRGPSHADAVDFAKKLATAVAKSLPDIATVERMKAKRGGRLYIDFLQNGEGKTIVAPYSIRPKDGAPVSTPITWSEVTRKLDPSAFTIRTVPKRVGKLGDLLAPLLAPSQELPNVK
jgi:bifunctional non-homologous end joining protein LigD